MAKIKKKKKPEELRGQLMLQVAAGRFFRAGVPINEHAHRRTVYSNAWFLSQAPVDLPVGRIFGSTEIDDVSTAMIEAVDRLEAQRWDGSDEFMVGTGGDDLIDDIAYVMTIGLNKTFSRNHDHVHRLVAAAGAKGRSRGAASLFPSLFDPRQPIVPGEFDDLKQFMDDLIALHREDFARIMRVIRNAVDATRRAIDDPTGAYTDLVAALESLGDDELTTPTTWDRYDSAKRKIIDNALRGVDEELIERVRIAVLEADRAGLKRRFITSTLARTSPDYYRGEAVGTIHPPRSADMERMLGVAYDIRSRRSHVLEDLGEEAWVFTGGAETTFEPRFQRILTLAGLWRLTRHVIRRFVADSQKSEPEPWDYRGALPGIIQAQLAPQSWVGQAGGLNVSTAGLWFNGVAEALIAWRTKSEGNGFELTQVVQRIELLVPQMPDGDSKTAMIAIHLLWHQWADPNDHRPEAEDFLDEYASYLDSPSPIAFTVNLLSRQRTTATWAADEWVEMASTRRAARVKGKEAPLPAALDALIQLEAADQLEAVDRHDEAIVFAAYAVEEAPGREDLLAWEERLLAEDHDPNFNWQEFLFGKSIRTEEPAHDATSRPDTSERSPSMPAKNP
jgi:hypothetical protein